MNQSIDTTPSKIWPHCKYKWPPYAWCFIRSLPVTSPVTGCTNYMPSNRPRTFPSKSLHTRNYHFHI